MAANNRWIARAEFTAQVASVTVTGDDATTTYAVTIGAATVSILGTGTGVNATAAAWAAALADSTDPRFQEITWSNAPATAVVLATANTAGTPFTMTAAVTGGAGTITGPTSVTANSSPSDVNNSLNWSNAAAPAAGDAVFIDDSSVPLLWNLSALVAVTVASRAISQSFSGTIGLPEVNTSGSAPYEEYRPTYWQMSATLDSIGIGPGQGSGRIKLDVGTVQTALTVVATGAGTDQNLEALLWKGTHASNAAAISGGSVGIAVFGAEAATLLTLAIDGGTVRCGAIATLGTVTNYGGSLLMYGPATTIKSYGGNTVVMAGNITTLTIVSGSVQYQGAGTIGTTVISTGGVLDLSATPSGRTMTTTTVYSGYSLLDPLGTCTWTNPITFQDCTPSDGQLALRRNMTAAIAYS